METPTVILQDFEEITINNYKTTSFRYKYKRNNCTELIDKFNFTNDVVYKAGKTNVNADVLSRNPVESIKEDKNETNISESENKDNSKNSLNVTKESNIEDNCKKKSKSTRPTKFTSLTKSTNPTKSSDPL